MNRVVISVVLGTLLLLGGLVWLSSSSPANRPAVGHEVAIQGAVHIQPGAEHPPYGTNPPTSGWHYEKPANWGMTTEPIVDEVAVHNLEHGGVWLTYHPEKLDRATVDALNELVSHYRSKVLLSPRPMNDHAIAIVSWGRIETFDALNDDARRQVKLFLERNRNRGPERVPD